MSPTFFSGLLFLVNIINQCKALPALQNNGWIPLTEQEVFAHSRILPDRTQNKHFSPKLSMKVDKNNMKNVQDNILKTTLPFDLRNLPNLRNKAIKLVNPELGQRFDYKNVYTPVEPETVESVNGLEIAREDNRDQENEETSSFEIATTTVSSIKDFIQNKTNEENSIDKKERKSKAISETTPEEHSSNVLGQDKLDIEKLSDDADNSQRRSTKEKRQDYTLHYEVTEDTREVFKGEPRNSERSSGYTYTRPTSNLNLPRQNNLTDIFLNILSRHNIQPEDELPNYTLSRKTKNQGPVNAFMFIPIPLKVLPQFNNLKQLSLDPLLAVLMSNYGYYFPGSYGIHSRYKNLYGHLASNNIHNNKPFGAYKIFSDTDSSN